MAVKVVPVENSESLAVRAAAGRAVRGGVHRGDREAGRRDAVGGLEAAVVSDENQARQLLDFYRAHITSDVPKPMLGVLSQRGGPLRRRLLRRKRARDDRGAARRAEGGARRRLGVPPADRGADDDGALARGAGRLRRAAGGRGRLRSPRRHPRGGGPHRQGLHRRSRARGRLPGAAVPSASRRRPGRVVARAPAGTTRALGRAGRGAAVPPGDAAGAEARELRLRIATTLHEKLAQPDAALAEVRVLLPDLHEDAPLARLLEGLLADERATPATRLDALDALRLRYEATGAGARVPDLLRTAIGFAERRSPARPAPRVRRSPAHAGRRLGRARSVRRPHRPRARGSGDRGQPAAARRGGARSRPPGRRRWRPRRRPARRRTGRRAELLVRAARVEDRQLGHPERASALFEDAIGGEAGTPELRLESLRRLEEIYDALGNKAKRLDALERLAAVEPKPGGKRFTWALAAELALEIGDVDRALGAWQARLALDPADVEALAAARDLLVRSERWPAVIELLRRRIESTPPAHQIRADLIEMATLARERLGDVGRAIEIWREVVTRFGDDDESVGALADLYTRERRVRRAGGAAVAQRQRRSRRTTPTGSRGWRMRSACSSATRAAAVEWYGRALDVDPAP